VQLGCLDRERFKTEEDLGRSGAVESLMRPEGGVEGEGEFEPSFHIRGSGANTKETKARGVVEGFPESFETGGGEDVLDGAIAVEGVHSGDGLLEDLPFELRPLISKQALLLEVLQ